MNPADLPSTNDRLQAVRGGNGAWTPGRAGGLVAASGSTGLGAPSWLGAEPLAVSAAVQGGFAVGGVMAGSGLAALWWKTRAMRQLHKDEDEDESEKS